MPPVLGAGAAQQDPGLLPEGPPQEAAALDLSPALQEQPSLREAPRGAAQAGEVPRSPNGPGVWVSMSSNAALLLGFAPPPLLLCCPSQLGCPVGSTRGWYPCGTREAALGWHSSSAGRGRAFGSFAAYHLHGQALTYYISAPKAVCLWRSLMRGQSLAHSEHPAARSEGGMLYPRK